MIAETTRYARILRAIARQLEGLSVRDFDLELDGDIYVVRGDMKLSETRRIRDAFRSVCKNWKKRTQGANHSSSSELTFSQKDIDRLEEEGKALRSDRQGPLKPHSLPQLLRTVGWYVDKNNGRLFRLTKKDDLVAVWYTGPVGSERMETFTLLNLYDVWVRLYKRRNLSIAA